MLNHITNKICTRKIGCQARIGILINDRRAIFNNWPVIRIDLRIASSLSWRLPDTPSAAPQSDPSDALDGEEDGFVKVHVRKSTDSIVGRPSSRLTQAMTHGLELSKIGNIIHPYPTQAEAIRRLGDQFSRTRLLL